MEQFKKETNQNVVDLSKEELENTHGGAWWEIRYEKGDIIWIFHYYD